MGYYDQENQNLDPENTVLDELWDDYGDMNYGEVRNILAAFLFRQDDIEKQVNVLSGGEKSRLTIAKLILKKSNVLVLDEPTNHLDINSREALETALLDFKGTIIAVSHDRYFMKKLATRILELAPELDGGYIDYKDGYEEYISYKRDFLLNGESDVPEKDKKISEQEESRKLKRRQEQLEKDKRTTELEIKRIEKRIAELDFMIKDDEVEANYVKLNEIYEEKNMLEERLEGLYEKFYAF
jgi:ATP-binding cassette subfamily F protein 3